MLFQLGKRHLGSLATITTCPLPLIHLFSLRPLLFSTLIQFKAHIASFYSAHPTMSQKRNAGDSLADAKRLKTARTQNLPSFKYTPLDLASDSQSIRVLEILPGPEDSVISCKMWISTIDAAEHTCLSYTWQPHNPEHEIVLNNGIATVGHNLYLFLQAARLAKITQPLWIDALCIDQSANKEKSHQVNQMGRIYEAAEEVLVWLKEPDDDLQRLVSLCESLVREWDWYASSLHLGSCHRSVNLI